MKGYKFCLIKAYFDKGIGLTNYVKYLIAFFGISSLNVKATLILAVIYLISCFFLGWFWFKYKFIEAETEVNNRFNPFVKEMRGNYSAHRKRKI